MKTLDIAETGERLARYIHSSTQEPVILTERGTPVAAVIPIEGIDQETLAVSTSPVFQAIMERARARRVVEGGLSHEQVLRDLGMDDGTAPPDRDR